MERIIPPDGSESYKLRLDGEGSSRTLVVLKREPGSVVVALNNRVYSLRQLKRTKSSVSFLSNGRAIEARFRGAETSRRDDSEKSGAASVNEMVSSNFPAKVVSIKAKKGSRLREGDTLLILEAMKMEAQVKVPRDCVVQDLLVSEGDMVPRGARLAQLKFD